MPPLAGGAPRPRAARSRRRRTRTRRGIGKWCACSRCSGEQALTQAVEQYLTPTTNGYQNLSTGLGVCLDLGLFYLDNDRLDDADQLFLRLELIEQQKAYRGTWASWAMALCWRCAASRSRPTRSCGRHSRRSSSAARSSRAPNRPRRRSPTWKCSCSRTPDCALAGRSPGLQQQEQRPGARLPAPEPARPLFRAGGHPLKTRNPEED